MTAPGTLVLATADVPSALLDRVRALLDAAFDGDFADEDWDHTLGGVHALVLDGPRVLAHAAVVPRTVTVGTRPFACGYVEGVAADPAHQGRGLGTLAMRALDPVLRDGYELGTLSTGEHRFYERLGWERWRGPTFVRRAGGPQRTPEEDDGIMVLRFGASADVDLAAPIACEERPGDDW